MADDISYIRKWLRRGISKDGLTLDLSGKGIRNPEALELAEYLSVPDLEILYSRSFPQIRAIYSSLPDPTRYTL